MAFQIIRNDITKMEVDAIVNSTNEWLIGITGADGAINRAAGPELAKACQALGGCRPGEAKITKGYQLKCKYIIHTVTPIWKDGLSNEISLLEGCYRNALQLAESYRCKSLAFPLMGSGNNGFPKGKALTIATEIIQDWLNNHHMDILLVVYDKVSFSVSEQLMKGIESYIDDHYVSTHHPELLLREKADALSINDLLPSKSITSGAVKAIPSVSRFFSLSFESLELDESFSQMLLRLIDRSGMTDAECYHKANIDRRLFSKIRSDPHYHPKKTTIIAFAMALQLSMEETEELLKKAGFALSNSQLWDVIVSYFIKNRNYNIFELNEVLFEKDLELLQ